MVQKDKRLVYFGKMEPGAEFLVTFFAKLKDNHIDYCVLRNYKFLPFSTGGSDLDILVAGYHFNKSIDLIEILAKQYGGKVICEIRADRVVSLSVCGFYDNAWWGVKFDLFTYVGTNGCDLLPAGEVLARCCEYNGVMVVDDQDGAVVAFLKEVIGAGKTKDDYREQALRAFSQDKARYLEAFSFYWGDEICKALLEPLLYGNIEDFAMVGRRLKREWFKNMFRRQPLQVARSRVVDFFSRVKRVFFPEGFSVAFIGTDGSGKSTVIDGIRSPLESALHSTLRYEHMRPNLLPSLARLLGGKPHEQGKSVTAPHGSTSSGFTGSLFRLVYYSFDYILGHWLKVYPNKVRRSCLYVFDRYFYDFMLDQTRSRISLPKKLVEWFRFFIPEPDLILCLGADPEVIHTRKPELSLGEVIRQIDGLREFCDKTSRAVWVDTGLPVEESINQALSTIVDCMAARHG